MADLLGKMRVEAKSENVAYGHFLLDFKKSDSTIYNFLEGEEDVPYYEIRLSQNTAGFAIKIYSCNGKKGVINVCGLINSVGKYAATRFGYFIDKDFDPPLKDFKIYETNFHSVENFFTDIITLKKILRIFYRINEQSDDFQHCVALYVELFKQFHDYVTPINAWISCYIDRRHSGSIIKSVNINSLTEHLFINVIDSSLTKLNLEHPIQNFHDLQLFFDNSVDISEQVFERKLTFFEVNERAHLFRGKFEIQFLTRFLHLLKHKLQTGNNGITVGKYNQSPPVELKTIMVILSGYAHTPDSLLQYIRRIALS